MPAPATHAQVKAAPVDPDRLMDTQMNADDSSMEHDRQALNKQMDTQMNADLAKSIDAFNRNYYVGILNYQSRQNQLLHRKQQTGNCRPRL